jgi:hypothetical protein
MTIDSGVTEELIENSAVPALSPAGRVSRVDRWLESTSTVFAMFVLIAGIALVAAMLSVHNRQPDELLKKPGSVRSHVVLSHWMNEGYFHYVGMLNRSSDTTQIYTNSTGGYMVSGFVAEKVYSMIFGRYSYRLLALHNQFMSMLLSALAGLLSYRLARRFGLEALLAFTAGAAVVIVMFTFPDNLDLYWEMSAQTYGLLFALVYLLIEERGLDLTQRPRSMWIAQGAAVFLMAVMESIFALGFVASVGATLVILRRDGSWKRFLLVAVLPCVAALVLYQLQLKTAAARFPNVPTTGSKTLWRTGFDGDSTYYGDHLDIARRRDLARGNWPINRQYLFRWTWVFILGLVSILGVLIGFLRDRAPRIALEALAGLTGAWLCYAAIFSQAVVIHPYLYDVLLFTPLCIALFALAPSLLESLTKRTGAILLVVVFGAVWYSFFQLRLSALRNPLPPAPVESPATKG